MKLTPEQELESAQVKVNYFKVTQFFGLTEKEALHPNAGDWIIDVIKQYQTTAVIAKTLKMRQSENLKVESYSPLPPLPPMPSGEGLGNDSASGT